MRTTCLKTLDQTGLNLFGGETGVDPPQELVEKKLNVNATSRKVHLLYSSKLWTSVLCRTFNPLDVSSLHRPRYLYSLSRSRDSLCPRSRTSEKTPGPEGTSSPPTNNTDKGIYLLPYFVGRRVTEQNVPTPTFGPEGHPTPPCPRLPSPRVASGTVQER